MKLTGKVKPRTENETFSGLRETLHTANTCCDWMSARAWKTKIFGQFALHKLTYAAAREKFGLSSQAVVRCIGKVCDAYKRDKRTKRTFWPDGAIAFDDLLHSWAFAQLGMFLIYKAALAGVPVIFVDPPNSSRECSACGHVDKLNRPSQSVFSCRRCSHFSRRL